MIAGAVVWWIARERAAEVAALEARVARLLEDRLGESSSTIDAIALEAAQRIVDESL